MAQFDIVIHGGRPLRGEVRTSGAKNAALPILASTILGGGECVLSNMPHVVDVLTMGKLLGMLGIAVRQDGDHIAVQAHTVTSTEAPYDLVRTMRASVLVLGPLVARFGEAKVQRIITASREAPVHFHKVRNARHLCRNDDRLMGHAAVLGQRG